MRGKPATFTGFTGGVNLADAPYQLGEREARDVLNVVASGRGSVRKRDGTVELARAGLPAALHSLFGLEAQGALTRLIGAGGGELVAINGIGSVTTLATGLTPGAPWEFVEAPALGTHGPLYAMNGVDAPRTWDGTTLINWTALSGNLPNAKYLLYKGTRVWFANVPGGYTPAGGTAVSDPGSALVFSDLGNPRSIPAENVVEFDPGDGEAISGIGSIGPYIVVFKPSKAWVVYDLDTGANRRLGDGAGCISHRSIAETPAGTMFLSREGLRLTNGDSSRIISDRVAPLLEELEPSLADTAVGAYHNRHYYLAFSSSGSINDRMLDYDTRLEAWWIHSVGAHALATWSPAGQLELYGSRPDGADGIVEHLFVPGERHDAGAAFRAFWAGPYHTFDAPYLNKRVRRVHLDGKGRIEVSLSRDFEHGSTFETLAIFDDATDTFADTDASGDVFGRGEKPWGGLSDVGQAEVLTPGVARAWSVVFGNATADTFEVDSYTFAITMRRSN